MTAPQTPFRILNIKALVADFRQRKVDETLKFKYLLVEFVLLMFVTSLNVQVPPEDGLTWLLTTALLMVIVAVGTIYCFRKNQQGDNTDFTARYIAVNFVVSMHFFLAYAVILIALVVFFPLLEGTAFMAALGTDMIFGLILIMATLILYYYLVAKYIGQIAQGVTPTQDVQESTRRS